MKIGNKTYKQNPQVDETLKHSHFDRQVSNPATKEVKTINTTMQCQQEKIKNKLSG